MEKIIIEVALAILGLLTTIGLFIMGRNYAHIDSIDGKVDALEKSHARLDEKSDGLIEKVADVKHTHKTIGETIMANHRDVRDSLHRMGEKNGETYARRDDLARLELKIDNLPERILTLKGIGSQ